MSEELEAAKSVATHPISLVGVGMAVIGWLANRVWRSHRHELADMKQATSNAIALIKEKVDRSEMDAAWKELEKRREIEAKLFDMMREHENQDHERFERQESASRDRHDEMMAFIGDLRVDIQGLKK